jgi:hypothetical protein
MMGRPRKYLTNADKQRAYRRRVDGVHSHPDHLRRLTREFIDGLGDEQLAQRYEKMRKR